MRRGAFFKGDELRPPQGSKYTEKAEPSYFGNSSPFFSDARSAGSTPSQGTEIPSIQCHYRCLLRHGYVQCFKFNFPNMHLI